jgi:hypothetical protein
LKFVEVRDRLCISSQAFRYSPEGRAHIPSGDFDFWGRHTGQNKIINVGRLHDLYDEGLHAFAVLLGNARCYNYFG